MKMDWYRLVSLICTVATVHGSRLPSPVLRNTGLQSLRNTDCFCSVSGSKITDNLDPENDGLVRLVIFAYQKVSTGEITIFIPQRKYQYCIQDFPLSKGKAYKHYEKHHIHEIFENLANKNAVIEEPVEYNSQSNESDEISLESSLDSDIPDNGNSLAFEFNSAEIKAEKEGSNQDQIPYWQIPVTDYVTGRITENSHEGPYYFNTESLEDQKIIPQKWILHASEEKTSPSLINEYVQNDKLIPKETFNHYYSLNSQYASDDEEDATPSQFDLYLNEGEGTPVSKPHVLGVKVDDDDDISPQDNSGNDSADEDANSFEFETSGSEEVIYNVDDTLSPQKDSGSELSELSSSEEDDNSSQFDVYLNEGNHAPETKPHSSGKLVYYNDDLTPQFNSREEHSFDQSTPSQTNQYYGSGSPFYHNSLSIPLNKPPAENVIPSIFGGLLKGSQISLQQTLSPGGLLNFPQHGLEKSTLVDHILGKEVEKHSQFEREGEEYQVSGVTSDDNTKLLQDDQYVSHNSESYEASAGSQKQQSIASNHMMFPKSNEYEYASESSESSDISKEKSDEGYNSIKQPLLLVEESIDNNSNDNQSLIDSDTQEQVSEESSEESTEAESLHFPGASFSKIHSVRKVLKPHGGGINRTVTLKQNHGIQNDIQNVQMNFKNSKNLKGTYGGNYPGVPYRGNHKPNKQASFNRWFQKQLKGIKDNGTDMPTKPAVIKSVRRAISKTLRKNGLWVSKDGQLHSANGIVSSLSNLKLQPLLIGRSVPYDHLIKIRGKYKVPPRTPFIEGLLMSMLRPTKILGIVPLGITSLSRRFNPNGEYMLQIERRKLDPGAQKALSQILPSRRSSSTLAVTSPNDNLNHLWRSVSDILRKGGTTVTKITGTVEGKEDRGVKRPHGEVGHVHSDGEDTSDSDDDEVLPGFRIIGGISATGTGTPIASKGRSGID